MPQHILHLVSLFALPWRVQSGQSFALLNSVLAGAVEAGSETLEHMAIQVYLYPGGS